MSAVAGGQGFPAAYAPFEDAVRGEPEYWLFALGFALLLSLFLLRRARRRRLREEREAQEENRLETACDKAGLTREEYEALDAIIDLAHLSRHDAPALSEEYFDTFVQDELANRYGNSFAERVRRKLSVFWNY
jgi:predicted N-acyltransferase